MKRISPGKEIPSCPCPFVGESPGLTFPNYPQSHSTVTKGEATFLELPTDPTSPGWNSPCPCLSALEDTQWLEKQTTKACVFGFFCLMELKKRSVWVTLQSECLLCGVSDRTVSPDSSLEVLTLPQHPRVGMDLEMRPFKG